MFSSSVVKDMTFCVKTTTFSVKTMTFASKAQLLPQKLYESSEATISCNTEHMTQLQQQ